MAKIRRIKQKEADGVPLRQVATRWTRRLARGGWTPVSDFFLANYHRLRITHTEAMLIVHLLSFKWDHAAPFPALKTLAQRMGITPSSVRAHLRSLGKKGYLIREINVGKTNRFHLQPLFRALESLMSADRIEALRASEDESIKIELISHELGMGKIVGQVTFSSLPVRRPKDFSCEPSGILPFDAAKAVSEMLAGNLATGEVGELIWRLC